MIVNELGQFVAQMRYQNLPAEVVDAIKLRVLDVLGAALAGFRFGTHKHLIPLLGGAAQATAWGMGTRFSLRDAILLNSFLAHSTYLDDGSRSTGGHPSSVVIPSAMALAETEHASGRDLIAAVAVGYDVFLRLGRAIYPSTLERGFQSTAVLGAVASAAASANLLHLSPQCAKNALAIACTLGGGLMEALKSSGSQPLQVARSCEGGVLAAMYARQGAEGAESIIENGLMKAFADNAAVADVLVDLGTRFRVSETYMKVHGGVRGNHAPIDVILDLVKGHNIKPAEIEHIEVGVDKITFATAIPEPRNGKQAQLSVAFCVAAALLEGNVSIFQFTDEKLADPRMRALMARIRVTVDSKLYKVDGGKRGAAAEIALKNGRRYSGSIENARGGPEFPFSAAEIENKFLTLSKNALGANTEPVRDMVMGLEKLADVGLLAARIGSPEPVEGVS